LFVYNSFFVGNYRNQSGNRFRNTHIHGHEGNLSVFRSKVEDFYAIFGNFTALFFFLEIVHHYIDILIRIPNIFKVAFLLHEGAKVEILDEVGDWYKLKIADGRTGWVKKHTLKTL